MSYLWIDLWNKKCWIAVEVEWVVFPKSIVPRVSIIKEIKRLIDKYSVDTIIVWAPHDLYWIDNKQLDKTRDFTQKLKDIFSDLKVEEIDERYTSIIAKSALNQMQDTKSQKDAISAALILETYLKFKNR